MNATETAKLCSAIAQSAPAQRFDEDTPAFWAVLLAEVRYEDARQAVVRLLQRRPFVAPVDIITEVKAIRRARLEHSDRILPDIDPDDVPGWLAARRAGIAALADGTLDVIPPAADGALDGRLRAALPALFRRPPRPATTDYHPTAPRAIAPPQTLPTDEAERMETERRRQLAALEAMTETDTPEADAPEAAPGLVTTPDDERHPHAQNP